MMKLYPFHTQLSNAGKLFFNRWGSAVFLQLLTLIPGVLMYPLVSEYSMALVNGVDSAGIFETSQHVPGFFLGFFLFIILGVFVSAATGILFAAQEKISLWGVLAITITRYIPVLYTSILSALAVSVSLIPVLALNYWYTIFARTGAPVTEGAFMAVDTIILIALVALLIPVAIVVAWVMYAPLAVALRAAPAGFTAIMYAKHLVHRHVWQLVWRIVGSIALFQIISASVSTLPYASFIVPFTFSIIIMAFFVEIYKELQQGQYQV